MKKFAGGFDEEEDTFEDDVEEMFGEDDLELE